MPPSGQRDETVGEAPSTTQGSILSVESSKLPFSTILVVAGGPAVVVVASIVVLAASSTFVEVSVSWEVAAVVVARRVVKELIPSIVVAEDSTLVSESVTLKVS